MYKKLSFIYLFMVVTLGITQYVMFNKHRKASLITHELKQSLSHLYEFSKIETHNKKTTEKYKGAKPQELNKRLEEMSLAGAQKIKLVESTLYEGKSFSERELSLEQPVIVDLKDVNSILAVIEPQNSEHEFPHCIIKSFSLKKTKDPWLYFLNFKIIKREYHN